MKKDELLGKKCYNHLGGKLGATLFDFLVAEEWITLKEGSDSHYVVTEKGYANFEKIGLELPKE